MNHDGLVSNDRQDWRLYTGAALLAWSFLGRFILPLAMAHGGSGRGRMHRSAGREIATPDGAKVWYLQVIHALAQREPIATIDISGLRWGEVDFPPDLDKARQMVADWADKG